MRRGFCPTVRASLFRPSSATTRHSRVASPATMRLPTSDSSLVASSASVGEVIERLAPHVDRSVLCHGLSCGQLTQEGSELRRDYRPYNTGKPVGASHVRLARSPLVGVVTLDCASPDVSSVPGLLLTLGGCVILADLGEFVPPDAQYGRRNGLCEPGRV